MSQNKPPSPQSAPEPDSAAPVTPEAATAAAAVETALDQIATPAQAGQAADALLSAAAGLTEHDVQEQTRPAPAAAAAADQAQQAQTPEQAGAALLAASAAIASASDQERPALEQAVQNAIGPADAADQSQQQRLLREAVLARMPPLQRFDAHLFLAINQMPHPQWANTAMSALTTVMNSGMGWLLIVVLGGVFDQRYRQALRRIALPLWVATLVVEYPIKLYVRRRRPFTAIVQAVTIGKQPGSYSFPSGHSASAFAGARLLTREFPELALCWYALAALTGFSRVYLGVHYPGDVLSGAVIGTLLSDGVRWMAKP